MSKDKEYCDHCAEVIVPPNFTPYAHLPMNLLSANAGESGIVCSQCDKLVSQFAAIRTPVSRETISVVMEDIRTNLSARIRGHGPNTFAGTREALGAITQEYHELIDEIHVNNSVNVYKEANDLAVGCLWLMATLRTREALS